jgi:hypothetical protein
MDGQNPKKLITDSATSCALFPINADSTALRLVLEKVLDLIAVSTVYSVIIEITGVSAMTVIAEGKEDGHERRGKDRFGAGAGEIHFALGRDGREVGN